RVLAIGHHELEIITSGLVVRKNLRLCSLVFVLHAEHASIRFVRAKTVGAVIVGSGLIIPGSAGDCDVSSFYGLTILREVPEDVPRKSRHWPDGCKAQYDNCFHDFLPMLDPTSVVGFAIVCQRNYVGLGCR